jgi:hypothetical protein
MRIVTLCVFCVPIYIGKAEIKSFELNSTLRLSFSFSWLGSRAWRGKHSNPGDLVLGDPSFLVFRARPKRGGGGARGVEARHRKLIA